MKEENEDIYDQQIKKNLKGLNREQAVYFSWLCSVRVLPFIGSTGNFSFWIKRDRMQHLYNILKAIDIVAFDSNYDAYIYDVHSDSYIINSDIVRATSNTVVNANRAINAITSNNVAASVGSIVHAATRAVGAATSIAAVLAAEDVSTHIVAIDRQYNTNLHNIILCDIEYIKSDTYNKFDHNTDIYNTIWGCFHKALSEAGCIYWSELYSGIFRSGFQKNEKELKRRLMDVPEEIKSLGAKEVADYLCQLESGGRKSLNEARIIILGEKGAGKTCLARRLKYPKAPMTKLEESTEGVDNTLWKIKSKYKSSNVNAHIWDFAGHVITHAVHRCFLSERCLYIIVYDSRTEVQNRIDYWLDHVKTYGGNTYVWIVINKKDNHKPDISENYLKGKYPFIRGFTYFSIDKDKALLNNFRAEIAKYIQGNPMWNCLKIPTSYYKVKKALEKCFRGDDGSFICEHISEEQFNKIAYENGVSDEEVRENLLKALHELGICLWYKDIEKFNSLILNPKWISHGIYKAINWSIKNAKHTISHENCEDIFHDEKIRYPKDKFKEILELMKRYELAYSQEDDNKITIPHLLKKDQPSELPGFPISNSLMIRYVSEQPLPPNTVCRLIVRHHEEIRSDREVWRYGVVLEYREKTRLLALALVQEDDRTIIIKVSGIEKTKYIVKLRDTMDEIFSTYKSKRPELQYRVIDDFREETHQKRDAEILLSNEALGLHLIKKRSYLDPKSGCDIPWTLLRKMLQAYNINNFEGDIIHMGDIINITALNGDITDAIVASGNSTVIQQKNGIEVKKLDELIEILRSRFPKDASEDDIEKLNDSIEIIKDESKKQNPEKKYFRMALNTLRTIKETTEFSAAIAMLAQFFDTIK